MAEDPRRGVASASQDQNFWGSPRLAPEAENQVMRCGRFWGRSNKHLGYDAKLAHGRASPRPASSVLTAASWGMRVPLRIAGGSQMRRSIFSRVEAVTKLLAELAFVRVASAKGCIRRVK